MKRTEDNSYNGQSWAWPRKTWFQERLHALKAQEREARRKPGDKPQSPTPIDAKGGGEKPPKED